MVPTEPETSVSETYRVAASTPLLEMLRAASFLPCITMLSTHGYMAGQPPLGTAGPGEQVVYELELSKKLAQLGCEMDNPGTLTQD